jgi:outer membrane receptor protein involved in Fe transport
MLISSLFCALLAAGTAFAQPAAPAATATLSGVVLDESGAALDQVEVIATNTAIGLQRTATTGKEGAFTIPLLPPGPYLVTAQREGFAAAQVQELMLGATGVTPIRIQLRIASPSESVVVTAQKRGAERVQDVPVPVAVIDTEQLASNRQVLLRDYYSEVPGLSLAPNYLARQQLSIRGVMTGGNSNPTVGVAIDDVPFGASTDLTGGGYVPDLDPGDLARVEVLRGPQGTLYGANSMGGLVKYVTVEPTFDRYSGRIEVGTNSVYNGDSLGYTLRGSANLPLGRTWALRASGYSRLDPGYVDNPIRHVDGLNRAMAHGGLLTALWRPSQKTSLRLSAMYQHADSDGAPEVEVLPGLGDLQQNFLADTRGYDRTVQAYSGVFSTRIGGVALTSITGFNINDLLLYDDRSMTFPAFIKDTFGADGLRARLDTFTKRVTQEVRGAGSIKNRLDWTVGGFYAYEDGPGTQTQDAIVTATGETTGRFVELVSERWAQEAAVFAGVTAHITRRLDLQLGVRQSQQELVVPSQVYTGPFTSLVLGQPSPFVETRAAAKTTAFTYLVTPQFTVSPDLMLYARFASGYRPGGPNGAVSIANGAPGLYLPDKTHNYEVGAKASLLAHRLFVDASVYYIDWQDIQIGFRIPTATYSANGGAARSRGVELSMTSRLSRGLTLAGWAAFNDAVLTESFPSTSTLYGVAGNRLPFATRWSSHLSIEQSFPIASALGFVGASASYVGDRVGTFLTTAVRQDLPAYTKADLRAGIRKESWGLNVFVTNLTDKRGLINGGLGYIPTNAFAYIQPRTFGVSVTRSF